MVERLEKNGRVEDSWRRGGQGGGSCIPWILIGTRLSRGVGERPDRQWEALGEIQKEVKQRAGLSSSMPLGGCLAWQSTRWVVGGEGLG